MKTNIAIVFASFFMAGSSTADIGQILDMARNMGLGQYAPVPFATGPSTASPEEVRSMSEIALPLYLGGYSMDEACTKARNQLRISTYNEVQDLNACAESLQARVAKKAEEERIALIRQDKADIRTVNEAAAILDAADGQSLAFSPLLQPDNRRYTFSGFIDPGEGLQPDRFLMRDTNLRDRDYALILIDTRSTKMPANARSGSKLFIVGNYVQNKPYTTSRKTARVMPVFKATFVRLVD
ncbi:hypothetical protein DBL07_13835 [Achromobacter mucicolens]|uniref:hypothetical protein n=1 Tax=Achromobacter mucicolens TaxID=1389922 RepID=UPI000D3D3686|nr:hypothetical protein [Achromobacter mucicolens]PTX00538.1 hypothetical protein DBL07_13835 [Achromobacter mucicolens]